MEKQKEPKGAWHQEACEMRQNGATYTEISRKFSVSVPAAYFAVNPHKRSASRKRIKLLAAIVNEAASA